MKTILPRTKVNNEKHVAMITMIEERKNGGQREKVSFVYLNKSIRRVSGSELAPMQDAIPL